MSNMAAVIDLGLEELQLALILRYRFHPSNEEMVAHYLTPEFRKPYFSYPVVADVNLTTASHGIFRLSAVLILNNLQARGSALMASSFCSRVEDGDQKYPTGMRTNRVTRSGYWKVTGSDKEIFHDTGQCMSSSA
uniref:Protein CUP-SHAPED COTYLEDON 2 n=1 Tax=Aegilops tauschii TaxID=37682 RepID=M8BAJ6_AEGTA